jgi:hypothetical protein
MMLESLDTPEMLGLTQQACYAVDFTNLQAAVDVLTTSFNVK